MYAMRLPTANTTRYAASPQLDKNAIFLHGIPRAASYFRSLLKTTSAATARTAKKRMGTL